MKKFFAVLMALVMMFSLVALPASAAEAEEKSTITLEEFFNTVESSVVLIKDTVMQIHNIIGSILGVLGKECPMCAEVHAVVLEDNEAEFEQEEETLPEIFYAA